TAPRSGRGWSRRCCRNPPERRGSPGATRRGILRAIRRAVRRMTIADLNRRWRPPAVLAVWLAAVVLLWIDVGWLHAAAATTLGAVVVLSMLDARRETRVVVAFIAILGAGLLALGADPAEVLHGLDRSLVF